ncbi:response regulator [Eubacterium sp. MSJ-13]|uniref:response regulator n=1 Tax=Eubacterium sp. MSJ-13 TaxID=2841513 RepID=UPI001C118D9B|nr:response regulator [Eubacterium sp. MSJ-13]MBU5479447.1 response regulator [Eubacterium sp. MSJ-13]
MKVLLVDDAAFVRMSLKKILNDADFGFEYVEAGDGEEAIEKYKIYSPDLVIMDITMPKVDGITAVERIKEIDSDAKIIMCSAMGFQEKVVDAITAGAKDFIIKPYEADKVVKSIKAVLKLDEE